MNENWPEDKYSDIPERLSDMFYEIHGVWNCTECYLGTYCEYRALVGDAGALIHSLEEQYFNHRRICSGEIKK